jgi:hypothetical protein
MGKLKIGYLRKGKLIRDESLVRGESVKESVGNL